jgi:hypothetical protein
MSEPEKIDSLIDKSKHGGRREGAGRPEGSKNKATLEKQLIRDELDQRVLKNVDRLLNSQIDLAVGEKYLMVVKTIGKGAKQRQETTIVTDLELIKKYLDEDLDNTDEEYYYMTTKPANNQALQGLLDRTFGKASQTVENTGEQKIIIETRKARGNKND